MRKAKRRLDSPLAFKGFSNSDVDVSTTMVRLRKIEAEGDNTRIEMRGVREEMNGCKESAERMFHLPTEWKNDLLNSVVEGNWEPWEGKWWEKNEIYCK